MHKYFDMKKAILYGGLGVVVSFLLSYFLYSMGWQVDLYYAFAFGFGWGMAYYLDQPQWALAKKLGVSFVGIAVLVAVGFIFFDFEIAVPSILRYSTVFLVYYLLGSFRESKSLRH